MPDPASLYALYYEIVRSGIEPYQDLTKECKVNFSSEDTANLKSDHCINSILPPTSFNCSLSDASGTSAAS